jgi:hypothetical protein
MFTGSHQRLTMKVKPHHISVALVDLGEVQDTQAATGRQSQKELVLFFRRWRTCT